VQVNQTIFSEDGIELIHLWSCGEGVEICRDDEEDVFHIRLQENTQEVPHPVVTLASPDGKLLTEHTFDDCDDFQDGLLCVYSEGKGYGYIDLNGKLVIPPQYEETEDFYNNCAADLKQDEPDPAVIAGSDNNLISGNLTGGKSGYSPVRWQDLLQDQRP